VKNPDGTTTTRTANGAKVTRPGLKRNPNSTARLATVAANNHAAAKMQTLTRSKTADVIPTTAIPFQSTIYCSSACATTDAGRSYEAAKDIARSLSFEYSAYPPHIDTSVSVSDHSHPHAPPSPLFISGSDTESSNAGADSNGPACSAPKVMEYFRMSRGGPDDAWHEVGHQRVEQDRHRRSSMNPAVGARRYSMTRQVSGLGQGVFGEISSDSLSSLWEQDQYLARSASGGGRIRGMTPVKAQVGGREALGAGKRSTSSSGSETSVNIGTRPTVRSTLSQASLAASPPTSNASAQPRPILPPEFGSAPDHTLSLLQSYAAAFPTRDPSGTSTSYTQRGFVFPGSQPLISPSDSRRGSGNSSNGLNRPTSGTIRAPKPRDATWDALGKEEVRASGRAGRGNSHNNDDTPKQSLQVVDGRWKINYSKPVGVTGASLEGTIRGPRSRSHSRARSNASASSTTAEHDTGIAIPKRPVMASSHTSSRTPTNVSRSSSNMPPPDYIPRKEELEGMPDIAGLRVGSVGCGIASGSAPKTGFNWDKLEKEGGKTYELPKGLKIDRSKAGLFYFQ
jgi:hypothetical protein